MSFWVGYCGNMTSPRFIKMAAAAAEYYFRFRIVDIAAFKRSKSMSKPKPNFVDIPIDGWDITTSVFLKRNVRHIGNLLSISTIWPKSAHYSASGYRISSKSKNTRRKYDVISISQHGGRDGWILLPVLYMLMSLPSESQSLLANQILSRWMNEWMNEFIVPWEET